MNKIVRLNWFLKLIGWILSIHMSRYDVSSLGLSVTREDMEYGSFEVA